MVREEIKLLYINGQFRIKVDIPHAVCLAYDKPPQDILVRARSKMESIKEKGEIEFFEIYEHRLIKAWTVYRDKRPLTNTLSVVVAEGCPPLNGLELEIPSIEQSGSNEKVITLLTIKTEREKLCLWKPEWVVFYVNKKLLDMGVYQKVNPAQVHSAWLRSTNGEIIDKLSLNNIPSENKKKEEKSKPYSLIANKTRRELVLVVHNLREMFDTITLPRLADSITQASYRVLQQSSGCYHVLRKELFSTLQSYISGPEIYDIEMPIVILVGLELKSDTLENTVLTGFFPTAKSLKISVSDDAMSAKIDFFDTSLYNDPLFEANSQEWLFKNGKRLGLSDESLKKNLELVSNNLMTNQQIEGMILATGTPGKAGRNPVLVECYTGKFAILMEGNRSEDENDDALSQKNTEAQKSESNSNASKMAKFIPSASNTIINENETLDMRSLQKSSFVKAGQLVAEIQYQIPLVYGMDVFGCEKEPPDGDTIELRVKDGIIEKSKGRFFATYDGVPIIEDGVISISKVMIHDGDVNLRTGNIIFNGPVNILGSIDSGSVVEVSGNLHVSGSIRGGYVKCGGNIEVGLGINTGLKGSVMARHNLKADFIENSRVHCGGSITVKKVLLNSDVICGGSIVTSDSTNGVIAGGNLSCRKNIRCGNLGFKNGSVTKLNIGADWKIERAIRIKTQRLAGLVAIQESDRQALREVLARHKSQMTEKHEKRKKHYQRRLIKERALIEKIEIQLESVKAQLRYNPNSKVIVFGRVFANLDINMCGVLMPMKTEMIGISILAKRKHGSKIVTAEEGERLLKQEESDEDNED